MFKKQKYIYEKIKEKSSQLEVAPTSQIWDNLRIKKNFFL